MVLNNNQYAVHIAWGDHQGGAPAVIWLRVFKYYTGQTAICKYKPYRTRVSLGTYFEHTLG